MTVGLRDSGEGGGELKICSKRAEGQS